MRDISTGLCGWAVLGIAVLCPSFVAADAPGSAPRGGAMPEFTINPAIANPLLFFGPSFQNLDRTITIENTGEAGSILTLAADPGNLLGPPFSVVSGLPNNAPGIAQGASADIVVRCFALFFPLSIADELVLTTNDPDDGEATVIIPLQCDAFQDTTGELQATLDAVAVADGATVLLSTVLNGSASATLSIGNSSAFPLAVSMPTGLSGVLSASNPSVNSVPFATPPGSAGAANIQISCAPGNALTTTQTLSIPNSDFDENPFNLQITCEAAPAAVASIAPATLAIVSPPGVTGSAAGTLSNAGNIALDIGSCTAPPGFTLNAPATFPTSIAVAASTSLNVSCTTPAAGAAALTGNLLCQSNASTNGGVISVPLSCSGTPEVISTLGDSGRILLAAAIILLGLLGFRIRGH
jgi:hypothetical protein